MKNVIKDVVAAIADNSVENAQNTLKAAISTISKTAVKGAIHKRTAARKVSRLTKRVNAFVGAAQPQA